MRWSALNGCRLVLQDYASGSRPLIDSALRQQGVEAQVVQEIGHPATLFPMVAEGLASASSRRWRCRCRKGAAPVRRLVPEINRALMLVRRKNRSLTPAAEAIWQVARQQAALLHQRRQENAEY